MIWKPSFRCALPAWHPILYGPDCGNYWTRPLMRSGLLVNPLSAGRGLDQVADGRPGPRPVALNRRAAEVTA